MYDHLYWFLAKVEKDSPPSSPKVKVSYLCRYYANVDDPDRINIEKSSVIRVTASNRVIHDLWENKIVRVISDEEHLIPRNYEEFINIKKKTALEAITDAQTFEPTRERVVELADSFINARHYTKAKEVLEFLVSVEDALSGTTTTTTSPATTSTPTATPSYLSAWSFDDTAPIDTNRKRKFTEGIFTPQQQQQPKIKKAKSTDDQNNKQNNEGFCFFGVQLI